MERFSEILTMAASGKIERRAIRIDGRRGKTGTLMHAFCDPQFCRRPFESHIRHRHHPTGALKPCAHAGQRRTQDLAILGRGAARAEPLLGQEADDGLHVILHLPVLRQRE